MSLVSSNPQQQAVEALVAKFNPDYASYPLAPLSPRGVSAMTSFTASDGHRSIRPLNLGDIVDCLADAGLLCSSPDVQPEEQDGSLRSEPSASGPQWAVLRPDDHNIYKTETSARRVLLFLGEDGEEDYRLYEVREVPDA